MGDTYPTCSRVSSVEETSTAECVVIPFAARGIRHTFSTFHESIRHCGSNEASAYSMPVIMELLDSIFSSNFHIALDSHSSRPKLQQ